PALAHHAVGYHAARRLGADPGPPPDAVRRAPDHHAARPHAGPGARTGPARGTGWPGTPGGRVAAVRGRPGSARRRLRRPRPRTARRARAVGADPAAPRVPPLADAAHRRVPRLHAALRARAQLRVGGALAVGAPVDPRRLAVHAGPPAGHHAPGGGA